jgi:hypothetical protein
MCASLAFKMASRGPRPKMSRNRKNWSSSERQAFENKQRCLRSCKVAFIEIEDDLSMYLFEVYAAMKLGTGRWNTFATH